MRNTAKFGSFSITTSLDEINLNDGGVINTINPIVMWFLIKIITLSGH